MRLTKRGKIVRAILIGLGIALALWLVSSRVWYVPDSGYCIGTLESCYGL